jgi:hypothetical protein
MPNSGSKADSSVKRCDKALREKSLAGDMEQPLKPLKIGVDKDGQSIAEADRSSPDLGISKLYF